MLRPGTFGLTLLLSLLTAIGPLSMDMYLPSLPDIGRALHASTAQVQLTISSYLLGFAAGQLIYGPVSDRFGRRPVILVAIVLFGVASVVCATTQSIETLTAVRFVQALGGAGSIVLARAVVRDLYTGVRAGRELSLMGSITAFAPIVGPVIGGSCRSRLAGDPASSCLWRSRSSPDRRRAACCQRPCGTARPDHFHSP